VQNYIEQGAVNLQSALRASRVIDEAQFSETVHEKTDSRASGSNHLR
jgi:hypothetical protein